MCGIIGLVGDIREGDWGQTHRLLTELLVQSIGRGRDATGFAAVTQPYGNELRRQLITDKSPVAADEFTSTNPFWRALHHQRCVAVLGHVRAATSGTSAHNPNNHPHLLFGRRMALVHNGWFTNSEDVVDRHSLRTRTACDSEVAARLIEEAGGLPIGLYRCLAELKGAQALVVLDSSTGTFWAATDGNRPLWVARLSDGRRTVLASTPEIMERAIQKTFDQPNGVVRDIFPIAPGYVHAISVDGRVTVPYSRLFSRGVV
jgi:glucosamine 6-phosphate synthetase-like amidotransferase/phosphosugar isomerase protein